VCAHAAQLPHRPLLKEHGFTREDFQGLLKPRKFSFATRLALRIGLNLRNALIIQFLQVLQDRVKFGLNTLAV